MGESTYGEQRAPLAMAHRGGAGLGAENTLDAFERSYALGLRYFETDVRVIADGTCVAFHDATLDRVAGRPGRVRDMTPRELHTHDIPTLEQVLCAFPDARFAVDVKEAAAIGPLSRVLHGTNAAHRVCAAGAWDGWLARLRHETGPELTTALGWRGLGSLLACASAGATPPWWHTAGRFAHVPWRLAVRSGSRLADQAHALGVRVVVWTVNQPAQMHRVLDSGLDGIITDRPDLLREVLIARGVWQPPYVTASERDS